MTNIMNQADENDVNTVLLTDDKTTDDSDLIFPYSIVHLIKEIKNDPSKLQPIKCFLVSYYFQLLIVFMVSVTCIIVSSLQGSWSYAFTMTKIVFFVHGILSLITVLLHLCTNFFRSSLFLMTKWSYNQRQFVRYCTIVSHLFTIICIVWFFFGHIWLVQEFIHAFTTSYSLKEGTQFAIVMIIIQYIVGIWLLYCCTQHQKKISGESTINKQITDNDVNLPQDDPMIV